MTTRRRRRNKRRTRFPPGLQIVLAASALLVLVNAPIRLLGGNPNVLSPLHLDDKVQALLKFARHGLAHPFSDCPEDLEPLLQRAAKRHRIPLRLLRAVARVESGGRPHRISRTGAMGIMQLMPATAAELGVDDPFAPADNIDGAARYLQLLWQRYGGQEQRIVAAYNAGPGAVATEGRLQLPQETRRYLRAVLGP